MNTLDFFTLAGILLTVYALCQFMIWLVNCGHQWTYHRDMLTRHCPRCAVRQSRLYPIDGRDEWEDMSGAGGNEWCRKVEQGKAA